MLRLWTLKLFPFMEKWLHVAPACCGTCPTCLGVGVTGLALDLVAAKRTDRPDEDQPPQAG